MCFFFECVFVLTFNVNLKTRVWILNALVQLCCLLCLITRTVLTFVTQQQPAHSCSYSRHTPSHSFTHPCSPLWNGYQILSRNRGLLSDLLTSRRTPRPPHFTIISHTHTQTCDVTTNCPVWPRMKNEKMNYGHTQKVKQGIAEERKEVRSDIWRCAWLWQSESRINKPNAALRHQLLNSFSVRVSELWVY